MRRAEAPPPATLVALEGLSGPAPSGACEFPEMIADTSARTVRPLADSATLLLPVSWRDLPATWDYDSVPRNRFAGPRGSLVSIRRQRNGAIGRAWLANQKREPRDGRTCRVELGTAGAVWTFYPADPEQPHAQRPFGTLGDVVTPNGAWYGLSVWTASAVEQARVARLFTAALLRPNASP